MAEWACKDVASGKISPEQAATIFAELNTPIEQRAPDTRTDDPKMLDRQFPAAKESDYIIRYEIPGQEPPVMTKELKAFDTSARTWVSGAGLPRELGNTLVNTMSKVAQTTKGMTQDQLNTYVETEYVKLQKVFGATLDDKLQAAAQMIHALDVKTPGLKNLLKSKGIGDSALIVSMLVQQAEIFHARNKA